MNEQRMRIIFAEELAKNGVKGLAEAVRDGWDNSLAGSAAVAAMKRIVAEMEAGLHTDG